MPQLSLTYEPEGAQRRRLCHRWAIPLLAAAAAVASLPVNAISVAWDRAGGGHWAVASNWSPVGVPGAADDAFISMASDSPYTVTVTPYNGQVLYQAGSVKLTQPNATLSMAYTSGVSGVELALSDTLAVTAGTLRLRGAVGKTAYVHADNGMTFGAGAMVVTQGISGLGGNIANSGTMDMNSGGYLDGSGSFDNQGVVTIGASGYSVHTAIGHDTSNGGTFEVTAPVSGSGRAIVGAFTNLQGGMVDIHGRSTLALTQPGLVNRGVIALAGDGASISLLSGSGHVVNQVGGLIDLQVGNGGVRHIGTTLENAGRVEVAADLALSGYVAAHVNSGHIHLVDGARATVTGASFTNTATGLIDGNGTLDLQGLASFVDHGTLSPGSSFGRIDILGNYLQAADGVLTFEIGALGQDLIVVAGGTAEFDGTLRLSFVDGYAPGQGDTFHLISGAVAAHFSGIEVVGLASGYAFELDGDTGLSLITTEVPPVPEPGRMAMLLAGLGLVGWALRRRSATDAGEPQPG